MHNKIKTPNNFIILYIATELCDDSTVDEILAASSEE